MGEGLQASPVREVGEDRPWASQTGPMHRVAKMGRDPRCVQHNMSRVQDGRVRQACLLLLSRSEILPVIPSMAFRTPVVRRHAAASAAIATLALIAFQLCGAQGANPAPARGSSPGRRTFRAMRIAPPPVWQCQVAPVLAATHGADGLACDARFRAAVIRAALAERQDLGVSEACARQIADNVDRAAADWTIGDSTAAQRTEATACDGRTLTTDSLLVDDGAVVRKCPGQIWSWASRGAVDCSALGVGVGQPGAARAQPDSRAWGDAARRMPKAYDAYSDGNYSRSRDEALRALAHDSANAGAHAVLGASRAMLGDNAGAAASLRRAVTLDATNTWAWGMLALALYFDHRYDESVRAARDAIAADSSNAVAYQYLGMSAMRLGQGPDAEAALRRAATLAPGDARIRASFAQALRGVGKFAEAESEARASVRLAPDYEPGWAELGHALEGAGRVGDAIDAYRKAHKLADWDSDVNDRLAALEPKRRD
jgi:Flp pilus assembly protein TadD